MNVSSYTSKTIQMIRPEMGKCSIIKRELKHDRNYLIDPENSLVTLGSLKMVWR
ncbi:MAG: hypothetical protein ThorAB25_28080 [Candidatus Thorarchaeota archaeon AB_25]|nr:MAG: hypothetical protein ThorAB25_28080 [Candidatus Thorarchaeota archaeon AB_25]